RGSREIDGSTHRAALAFSVRGEDERVALGLELALAQDRIGDPAEIIGDRSTFRVIGPSSIEPRARELETAPGLDEIRGDDRAGRLRTLGRLRLCDEIEQNAVDLAEARRAASQRLDGHELGQDASTHARARRLDHGRKSGNLMVVPDDVAETRAREIQRRLDDPAFRRGGSVELVRGPELAAREMGVPDELD